MQAARQTAQNTKIAVKTTAKAVTHAIKALMEAIKALLSGLTAGGLDCSGDIDYRHFIWWISLHDRRG